VSAKVVIPPAGRLPLRVKIGNGFGSIAYGVKDNGFAVLLLVFYSQVLGLEAGLVGLILLIALLLDAMVDPLVGYWSDKTHSKWGKRHPWMYAAILPMTAAWLMLWHPPQGLGSGLYLYLLGFAFLMRAAVSCYEIPALSVVPGLSSDYDERTSITRWRYILAWIGGLAMLMLAFGVFLVPSARYPIGQLNVDGYGRYGWAGAVLMIFGALIGALSTHRRIARLASAPAEHLPLGQTVRNIAAILSNRAFLIVLGATLCNYVNLGMSYSTATYILTYYWEMPQAGFFAYSIALFVGVIGAMGLIALIQSRIEKRGGAVVCALISLAFALAPYLLRFAGHFPQNGSPTLIPLLFTLVAISNGLAVAVGVMVQSMAADVIEASQEQTGERSEGIFFSAYFFTQKCATGIGIFFAGMIVSLSQFPARARPGDVAPAILDHFALYFVIVLSVVSLIGAAIVSRFPITRADHAARLAKLEEALASPLGPAP
jgi:glycoside/pentoside/hexuronide:cation symporter, GPH family